MSLPTFQSAAMTGVLLFSYLPIVNQTHRSEKISSKLAYQKIDLMTAFLKIKRPPLLSNSSIKRLRSIKLCLMTRKQDRLLDQQILQMYPKMCLGNHWSRRKWLNPRNHIRKMAKCHSIWTILLHHIVPESPRENPKSLLKLPKIVLNNTWLKFQQRKKASGSNKP